MSANINTAGAAVGVPMSEAERKVFMVDDLDLKNSGLAIAYARARGADRMSSFGDIIALSDEVDAATASIISREVSDGVIAPAYSNEALEILSTKKGGKYLVVEVLALIVAPSNVVWNSPYPQINPSYEPPPLETRSVYGVYLQVSDCEL